MTNRKAEVPRVLIDINIILDVVLNRQPFVAEAAALLTAAENGLIEGHIAGHTITTIFYIAKRERGREEAEQAVLDVLRLTRVVALEHEDYHQALLLHLPDFEDAVQAAAAMRIGAEYIATRNADDFARGRVPPRTPGEILTLIAG